MGLIESLDAGKTWNERSLGGTADFHGIETSAGVIYGWDITEGRLMASPDGQQWEMRSRDGIIDFAVSPSDPTALLAVSATGMLRSADGGRHFTPVENEPAVHLLDWGSSGLFGTTAEGAVFESGNSGASWEHRGIAGGEPTAFSVVAERLLVAVSDGRILSSGNAGATWDVRYKPAQ